MKGPDRVRAALDAVGLNCAIRTLPGSTRTAVEAATAVGCSVAEIAKTLVFRAGDRAVVAIMSGDNRLDPGKLAAALGEEVGRADADFVRAATGFAIGGVPPLGYATPVGRVHGCRPVPLRGSVGGSGKPVQRVRDRAGPPARQLRGEGAGSQGRIWRRSTSSTRLTITPEANTVDHGRSCHGG